MNEHGKSDLEEGLEIENDPLCNRTVVQELERLSFEELAAIVDKMQHSLDRKNGKVNPAPLCQPSSLSPGALSVIRDMAVTRILATEKFSRGDDLFFTHEGLRWATPEPAAKHCAYRLRGDLCIDVSCGQGGQALFLAMECERVLAFDIDPLNCLISRTNARALGIGNLEVHLQDCLSPEAVGMAEEGCHVFSDPARPPGSRERTLEELGPDPRKVMEAYGQCVKGFCFELPPYIDGEKITFPHEAEYVSLNGRLNRLNIYTGSLALKARSAVVLPSGESISGPLPLSTLGEVVVPFPERYMFELDHAVVRAGLVGTLMEAMGTGAKYLELDGRRSVILSDGPLSSPFFIGSYRILGFSPDHDSVATALKEHRAGKVTPRYRMDPSSYWRERAALEKGLTGQIWVHLFRKGCYILAERVDGDQRDRG
ncbi:MAG: hypothetical protein MUC62_01935 [Candidatus Thermoplasmatota archaeon]|nr:hypothetical protein [Candidatus Thermoplasmatota archaeon]